MQKVMKVAGGFVLVGLALWVGLLASAGRALGQDPLGAHQVVAVTSGAGGDALEGAVVVVEEAGVSRSLIADKSGKVVLPAPAGWGTPRGRRVHFTVQAEGHLTAAREYVLDDQDTTVSFELCPLAAGWTSPLLPPGHAAEFDVPGVGRLVVGTEALGEAASLRLTPVPAHQRGEFDNSFDPRAAWHLALFDAAGRPADDALLGPPGSLSLRLQRTETMREPRAPGYWEGIYIDEFGIVRGRHRVRLRSADIVEVPLLGGLIVLHYHPVWADDLCRRWGPWTLEMIPTGGAGIRRLEIPITCGSLGGSGDLTVTALDSITRPNAILVDALTEVGWNAETLFAKLSAKLGTPLTGDLARGLTQQPLTASRIATPWSGTANGIEASNLTAPWSCVDGLYVLGLTETHYQVYARRVCLDPGLPGAWQIKNLGEFRYVNGLRAWVESLVWNASCPGCAPTGSIPKVYVPDYGRTPDPSELAPQ